MPLQYYLRSKCYTETPDFVELRVGHIRKRLYTYMVYENILRRLRLGHGSFSITLFTYIL